MAQLSLHLLGPPEILHAAQPLRFRTRKALALLVYLAAEGGPHTREQLTALLWPDSDSTRGRAALRLALLYVREALGEATGVEQPHLVVEHDTLRLDVATGVELDLHTLAAAAQATDPPGGARDRLAARLAQAAALYRGDFLEGFALDDAPEFDLWLTLQRETWRRRVALVFDRLSQVQFDCGAVAAAIATTARWLALAPRDETAYERLMRLYEAAGDRSAALEAFATYQARLEAELNLAPPAELVALAERIRRSPLHLAPSAGAAPPAPPATPDAAPPAYLEAPLLGREEELVSLTRSYHAARADHPGLAIVEGEAGIGKTRLLAEFLRWTAAQGADLLAGRAFEAGGRVPYQPVVDAIRRRVDQENAPDDLLSDVWLAELSRLLPELHDRYPDLPLPLPLGEVEARARLFEAVALLGLALAQRAPLVVWIDDLQWTDAASLDLLHYAARRWAESAAPILLLLSLRSEDLASMPRLSEWIAAMQRDLPGTRVTLEPLTAGVTLRLVEELAGDRPGDEGSPVATFSQWLYAETGGQPFYIVETLKALLERGLVALQLRADGRWMLDVAAAGDPRKLHGVIPPGVREVIRSRLLRLSPVALGLLTAGAVLGSGFDFDHLMQVAELAEDDALAALDEVLARTLVREDPERAAEAIYFFTHDKIRDVVYAEAGPARRRVLHRRALAVLRETRAPPAELAYHALQARVLDEAARWSVAAGDAALRVFALQDAIGHYTEARRLVELHDARGETSGAPQVDLQHLYLQLGRAHELNSDLAKGREVYEALLQLGQKLADPALECAALNRLATLAVQESNDREAAALLLRLAQQVAEASGNTTWLAETEWNLAQASYYSGDMAGAFAHGERALLLARELGQSELIARSLNVVAYAEWYTHRCVPAEAHAGEARALYAALGNRAMEADCLTLLAQARLDLGRVEAAIDDARAAQTLSVAIENRWGQAFSAFVLALGLLQHGAYGEALEVAQEGLRVARMHASPLLHVLTLLSLGTVQRTLFALEAARTTHQEALETLERMGSPPPFVAMAAGELCADCVIAADWDGAYTHATHALEAGEQGYPILPGSPAIWYETVALLRAGDHERAWHHMQRFASSVDGNETYRVAHLRALAALAEARSSPEQAVAYLEEAASLAATLGLPGEQWQIAAGLGRLYHALGDEAQARQAFGRSAGLLDALAGTIPDASLRAAFLAGAARCANVLDRLGSGSTVARPS